MLTYKAKITVYLRNLKVIRTCYHEGTKSEICCRAVDFMEEVVDDYIEKHKLVESIFQEIVWNSATYEIVWDGAPDVYVVLDNGDCYGVYADRASAEEAIFNECEDWVYECMMKEDPRDVFGTSEWDWDYDWKWLMNDCAKSFSIRKTNLLE